MLSRMQVCYVWAKILNHSAATVGCVRRYQGHTSLHSTFLHEQIHCDSGSCFNSEIPSTNGMNKHRIHAHLQLYSYSVSILIIWYKPQGNFLSCNLIKAAVFIETTNTG